MTVVEYLGPEGTFAHAGTDRLRTVPADATFLAVPTVSEVVHDVDAGRCDFGLVPLENSIEGGVTATIDVLVFEVDRVRIREEVVVPVTFVAFRRADDLGTPAKVALSHPFGLAQCKRFVADGGLRAEATHSTAEACQVVAASAEAGLVAVASAKAGRLAGLVPVAEAVEDFPGASTRFALVAREGIGPSGDDKTTLVLTPSDERAGVLLRMLHPFADRGISLTEIVSRPVRQQLGVYHFLVTVDHHGDSPELQAAIADLEADGAAVKLLGSYPAWREST